MTAVTTPRLAGTMNPPKSGVRIRMYRPGGIGDCFLLAFGSSDGGAQYMLIDCGVFLGTPGGAERMRAIAQDILQATGNRINTLVVTHEHWDHLSGLDAARKVFDPLQVEEAWFAWTEDPSDHLAGRLRRRRAETLQALSAAVAHLRQDDETQAEAISAVLDFAGTRTDLLAGMSKSADLIAYARGKASRRRYLRPGENPITWQGVAGVRVFVLGPPRKEELLTRSTPSKAEGEAYLRTAGLNEPAYFYAAVLGHSEETTEPPRTLKDQLLPFDRSSAIPWREVEQTSYADFFREHYGLGEDGAGEGPRWRRIDRDWLGEAGQLALQLDNDTNNTSLVLAIELIPSGRVLLFPGDAQVGNWLSWRKVTWRQIEGEGHAVVTGKDLMRRTVFYKVGHHGSHNATLRNQGLEMMDSPELVAALPVDEDQADRKRWAMPYPPLIKRLLERTRGRVIRSDRGLPVRPQDIPLDEWSSFLSQTTEDPKGLWVEYCVGG